MDSYIAKVDVAGSNPVSRSKNSYNVAFALIAQSSANCSEVIAQDSLLGTDDQPAILYNALHSLDGNLDVGKRVTVDSDEVSKIARSNCP